MSRTKRIERKVAYLGNRIEEMTGREKVDFALDLAKEIAVAPNKAALEDVLDDYIYVARHVTITYRNRDLVKPQEVEYIMLVPGIQRKPAAEVKQGNQFFYFPLTTGFEIHNCNEFLRSLGLDVNVRFETYLQYEKMLFMITELLKKRKALFPDTKVKETAPKDGFLHTVLTVPKPGNTTK